LLVNVFPTLVNVIPALVNVIPTLVSRNLTGVKSFSSKENALDSVVSGPPLVMRRVSSVLSGSPSLTRRLARFVNPFRSLEESVTLDGG
jgi:hypothetical protein